MTIIHVQFHFKTCFKTKTCSLFKREKLLLAVLRLACANSRRYF